MRRHGIRLALAGVAGLLFFDPAHAFSLNAFRRAHHRPPLTYSSALSVAAQQHAWDMARRNHLDHVGFTQRMGALSSTAAENVAYGCKTQSCAIAMWARSPGHRRNMLMKGVSRYGIASARSARGRVYWVLELGN
jgi:uncharacterized protein YkwD